ncbi:MAG: hypothetical protein IPO15_19975 [Anaerolineae bacterium]|nr:hypothetical protein [Anaerolineae bacterium]
MDTETGEVSVLRMVAAFDVGKPSTRTWSGRRWKAARAGPEHRAAGRAQADQGQAAESKLHRLPHCHHH